MSAARRYSPRRLPRRSHRAQDVKDGTGRDVGRHLRVARELRDQRPYGQRRRYRRPYVAVWVEDKDGFTARTLALWLQTKQPGPRWHPDLKRWYRDDQVRRLADDTDLIDTISRATRRPASTRSPGTARTTTASRSGRARTRSASRPHASTGHTRSFARKSRSPTKPFAEELKGNVEIKSASIDYRQKGAGH